MSEGRPLTLSDLGDLANSETFTSTMLKLNSNLDGFKALLELSAKCDLEQLSVKEQVMIDLFMAYAVNSLYWMFLRTQGINPATHSIKSEINRVREYVGKANKVYSRKNPNKLNKEAAKRFVRSGLWQPGQKPTGGVVKKFDSANVEAKASTSSNKVNEKSGEAKHFKAPNVNTEGLGAVKASSSLSKVNKKGGETKHFKAPNVHMEGVKASSSLNKANKNGGETKHFKAPNVNTEGLGGVKASSSVSKVNKKGGESKHFKAPNVHTEGLGAVKASSSLNKANKNSSETKHSKAPNEQTGVFKKFHSPNVAAGKASSSFQNVNKRGGETKRLKSPIGKTGKESKYHPYQHQDNEKHKYWAPHLKKSQKTTFHDSD